MRPGKSWKVTRQCQATAKTGLPLRATTDQGQRVTHAVLTSGAVLPGSGAVRPPTSGALVLADVAPVLAGTRPHLQVQMHPFADVAAVAVSQPRSHGTRRPGPVSAENPGSYRLSVFQGVRPRDLEASVWADLRRRVFHSPTDRGSPHPPYPRHRRPRFHPVPQHAPFRRHLALAPVRRRSPKA